MQRQREDRARRALRQLPGDWTDCARNRRRLNSGVFFARVLSSGIAASLASAAAGVLCSRFENRHGARALNAVAHIYDGGGAPPPPPRGGGPPPGPGRPPPPAAPGGGSFSFLSPRHNRHKKTTPPRPAPRHATPHAAE